MKSTVIPTVRCRVRIRDRDGKQHNFYRLCGLKITLTPIAETVQDIT